MTQFRTTAAYLSGGICGAIWWPVGEMCGKPIRTNMRGIWGFMPEGEQLSFRNALLSLLMKEGGDFQNAEFTADTVIRIERRQVDSPGKYTVHVKEIEIGRLADCADLVNADAYVGDFMSDD